MRTAYSLYMLGQIAKVLDDNLDTLFGGVSVEEGFIFLIGSGSGKSIKVQVTEVDSEQVGGEMYERNVL